MSLETPESVSRINDVAEYKNSQPDLDIYQPAFDGFNLHPRFAGTDLDGLFSATIDIAQPEGGLWEREGFVLVQEHKKSTSSPRPRGQFRALHALASIDPGRLFVIVTYGDKGDPAKQSWQHVLADRLGKLEPFTDDVEKWPHRRWMRLVRKQSATESRDQIADMLALIAKIERWKQSTLSLIVDSLRGVTVQ